MEFIEQMEYAQALGPLNALLPQLSGEDRLVALYWKARCLAGMDEWKQARTVLDEALKQVDADSHLRIHLRLQDAFLLEVEDGPDRGVQEIQSILDHYADELKTPELLEAWLRAKTDLGSFLVKADRYSEAVEELEQALSLQEQPQSRYYLHYYLGHAYYMLGDLAGDVYKAKDHFECALREAESSPPAGILPYYAATLRYDLAVIAYRHRQLETARRHIEFALAVPSIDREVSERLERLKTQVERAEAHKENVSLLRQHDPRFRPAMQLMEQAKYAETLRHLDALLPQLSGEDRLAALYWRARILKALGEWKRARTCLDEALQRAEPNSHLFISLKIVGASFLYIEQGPAEAAAEIRSIFDHYSEELKSPDLYWTCVQAKSDLGHFLLEAGRYSEAIKELEDALSVETRPLTRYFIYFWIGLAAIGLGDLDKGKDYLERASHQAESAPAAGVSPYYTARLRYELARIAYRQLQFDDARRQIELAQTVPSIDSQLTAAIEKLKNSLDRPQVQ